MPYYGAIFLLLLNCCEYCIFAWYFETALSLKQQQGDIIMTSTTTSKQSHGRTGSASSASVSARSGSFNLCCERSEHYDQSSCLYNCRRSPWCFCVSSRYWYPSQKNITRILSCSPFCCTCCNHSWVSSFRLLVLLPLQPEAAVFATQHTQ